MATRIKGNIPKNLKIFARPPIKVTTKWDDGDDENEMITAEVIPVFVADATNSKTQATGKTWAEQQFWDYTTQTRKVSTPCVPFEIPNTPFTSLQIISLEYRGQGGRAYKVRADGKYYVDLREDVLLDAMLNTGIVAGGFVRGEFIFAMVNSEMKVVRVGSSLHDRLVLATAEKAKPAIGVSGMVPGKVYFRPSSHEDGELYLGEYFTQKITTDNLRDGRRHYSYGHAESFNPGNHGKQWRLSVEPTQTKVHLFVSLKYFNEALNADSKQLRTYFTEPTIVKTLPKFKSSSEAEPIPQEKIDAYMQFIVDRFNHQHRQTKCFHLSDTEYVLKYRPLAKAKGNPVTTEQLLSFL
jgi:hypothetical protein